MRRVLRHAPAALVLVCLSAPAFAAVTTPYLFEQLRKPAYRATFMALFKGRHDVPAWLRQYLRNRDGVDAPMEPRTADGHAYEFYQVCQPHNCGGNFIYVLFEPGGGHAWAMLTKDDDVVAFFGNPDASMQVALKAAAAAAAGH